MLSIFSCSYWPLHILFGKISIQFFCPFFNLVVWFILMLSCISCVYMLDNNSLLFISFANIFSHSVSFFFFFILLMVCFAVQKPLHLIRSHLFIFVWTSFALGDGSKKIFLQFMSECYAYVFLQEFYSVQPYIQGFNSFCVYFCAGCQGMF